MPEHMWYAEKMHTEPSVVKDSNDMKEAGFKDLFELFLQSPLAGISRLMKVLKSSKNTVRL